MYKLIGSDGQMYGPVTGEQLRQWVAEGRVTAQTLVQSVGAPDWHPLAQFPELHMPPWPTNPPPQIRRSPRTNGFAVASLVLGAAGWALFCCGPVIWITSLILASVALSQIQHSAGAQTGSGLAMTGLGLSLAGLLALALWIAAACWLPTGQFSQFTHHGRYW